MKNLINIFFILLILVSHLNAQSGLWVRVLDSSSLNPIEKAIVYVEELPLGEKETDENGIVSFQKVPDDRKITLHLRKNGYEPQQVEVAVNQVFGPDNNYQILLEKSTEPSVFVLWGEVTDQNGRDVPSANVELTILGKSSYTRTDSSGNYRLEVNLKDLEDSSNEGFLEVKVADCKVKQPLLLIKKSLNQDIKLSCSTTYEKKQGRKQLEKNDPRIIDGLSMLFLSSGVGDLETVDREEARVIRRVFEKTEYRPKMIFNAESHDLVNELVDNKYDIVQLNVYDITPNSGIEFSDGSLSFDAIINLLRLAEVKLLILASCNSVNFAVKLNKQVNMIAATGNLAADGFQLWESRFYKALVHGESIASSFDISTPIDGIPISLLMTKDYRFTIKSSQSLETESVLESKPRSSRPIKLEAISTKNYGIVNYNSGNGIVRYELRPSPIINYKGKAIAQGAKVQILSKKKNDRVDWYQVLYQGKKGWIKAQFIEIQ